MPSPLSACAGLGSRLAALAIAVSLIATACTASTTIESVDTAQVPTAAAAQESDPVDSDPTPSTPQPTPQPTPRPTAAVEATPEIDETDTSDPSPLPTEAAATEEDQPPSEAVPPGTVQIVLLDAGAEPRTELRLMIAASCGEIMTLEQVQEITQTIDGFALPGTGPIGTIMEMSTSAARVGDNYETQAEIVGAYASDGVPADVAENLNRELERMIGIATFVTITDRGVQVPGTYRLQGASVLGPLESAVESLSQVQAPLPIEAVGIGARWEATAVVEFEGAELTTVTEYLVTDRDGTLVDMQITATQSVEPGSQMNLQGFEVEVTEWSGVTSGEIRLDLATISPIRSVATTQATQGLDFGTDGLLVQEIQSEITVTSEPNAGCTGRTTRP